MKTCDKCGNRIWGEAEYCICGGKNIDKSYDMAKEVFGETIAKEIFGDDVEVEAG